MIPILYGKNETAFTSNGLGRLRDCISCVVTEERNGIYECDFEYPVSGANYDLIQCGRIIAVMHDESNDIQPFDIVSYSRPIDGIVTFHAVHISYRQSKLAVSGTEISSLAGALTMLKSAVPSNPFTYWTNMSSTALFAAADGVPRSVRQMLGGTEGSILDCYGGEYEWDKWTVKLWGARGSYKDLTIRYGINLMGYDEDVDYSGTYTACIPYWVGSDNDSSVVIKGNKVSTGVKSYDGRESCIPLDLTDKFDEQPTAAQLENLAASLMDSNKVFAPTQNIKVEFARIQDSTEYASYAELMECGLCDTIKVVFPVYDTQARFKIVKTTYDVLQERFDEMELGSLSTTLADALGLTGNSGPSLSDVRTIQAAADALTSADQANGILSGMEAAALAANTTLNGIYATAEAASDTLADMQDAATAASTTLTAIYADAESSKNLLSDMEDAATAAHTTLTGIYQDAADAKTSAQAAQTAADSALVSLANVEDVVGVLDWITAHGTMTLTSDVTINPAHVYFVIDPAGDYVVGGTHYSIVAEPKVADISTYYELSVDESVQNYVATHVVVDTEGLWLIPDSGGNKVLIATGAGTSYTTAGTYIIGKVNGVDTVFAKFTTDGVTMNATNSTQIAHLGYGEGTAESGTANAPYYSIGNRGETIRYTDYSSSSTYSVGSCVKYNNKYYVCKTAITTAEAWTASHWQPAIGNYSVAENSNNIASGASSHAEGGNAGSPMCCVAVGYASHAEGGNTIAGKSYAHSEGASTQALGVSSHAGGLSTIAGYDAQTAIGKYNNNKSTSLFEIGNGTAVNARSNAFEVDSSGNVNIASGAKYKINGSNLSASDVGALPIGGGTMTSDGQIINGHITNSSTRETTPNLTPTGKRGITALLASSSMTTARPGEGTIIHCEWDTNGGWDSQLFIADNDSGNGKPFVAVRGQRSGTWTAWDRLLAQSDVADYVIAQSQSTTSYGDGYWRWREWNSGKVEIWYHGSLTLTTSEADSNGVKRYSRWFNFPNSYSLYRCTCIVNCMDQGGWYGCGGVRDSSGTVNAEPTRAFQVMGYRIQAQPPTTPTNLNIYICGQKTI